MAGIYAVVTLSTRSYGPKLLQVTTTLTTGGPMPPARQMWALFEPLHAITYYHHRARAAFEAAGLRGFWRGYFAGRAAPLGPVPAPPVIAAFFSFAPRMVTRALPGVWQLVTPEQALAARLTGAVEALAELTYDQPQAPLAEVADLLQEAAEAVDCSGRVLGAANAALPGPGQPLARLWQAATTLREHRGDGHVAALVGAGLDGCETLILRGGVDGSRRMLQNLRGWTDEEWQAATDRLIQRGFLDAEGEPAGPGLAAYREAERITDEIAAAPWRALGPARTDRLRELLAPVARTCRAGLPTPNPIGLPVA